MGRLVKNVNEIKDWHGGDRLADESLSDESTDDEQLDSQAGAEVQQPQRVKTLVGEEEWAPYLLQSLFRPTSELIDDLTPEHESSNESQFNMDEYLTTCKQVLMSLVPKRQPRLNNKDFGSAPAKAHHTCCGDNPLKKVTDIRPPRTPAPPTDQKGPRPGRRLRSFSVPGGQ
jgi:hypothetical protein